MQDIGIRISLVTLFALALLTAAINVNSTQLSYRLADLHRVEQEARWEVTLYRDQCNRLLSTDALVEKALALGWTEAEMFPNETEFDPFAPSPIRLPMAASEVEIDRTTLWARSAGEMR